MLSPEPEDPWVSAHVFTAHPLDLVVRRLLPAVVDDLRQHGLADRYFFLRHWQCGPHLRLRVRLTRPQDESAVRAALAEHATTFFQELPSSQSMTERQYRELAERFAALEPESEPGTLAANDSLAFLPYRSEHGKYGHGAALRAVEECFATCSELAAAAVLADWSPARRLAHCFALLVGSQDPGARPAALAPVPPSVVEQYRQRRAALLPVARAARAASATATATATATAMAGGADADPVTRWLAALRRAQEHATDRATDPATDPARLAGHLTHLACNRLGVRLDQEATLRGMAQLAAAETCDGAGHDDTGHHAAGHND
ncbi:lantibiotic dehydratase C-terminal domain-containing protein [Kitasatospora kifunensis]|uniref:Thiopeptide-type bacteriocin biosynthesis domain-containing protein n=1 Tax=Kitasatospora kifunensis TaxID=58351 RepID=A0A7W7RBN9_KITKI|nr:lantibiotic dehydratase C-terminal domain-containing protein [Kitasatospora kifunensis]MBB4928984.1 hypothetical protein [Kitasatospora kifunensis]